MKLRAITLLILFLFKFNISTPSIAETDIITKQTSKIVNNLGIEIAVKGKKLKEYFSGNTLLLFFEDKKKEFRFEEKKYEVFEGSEVVEKGKWKVSGLIKNQIKLIPENELKPYYFKKINNKSVIYHYDKIPGSESANKTFVEIIDPKKKVAKKNDSKEVDKKNTNSKKKSKKSSSKIENILKTGISNILGTGTASPKNSVKQDNGNTIQKHMLEKYRATSDVSYYFFEASLNYLQALELLYRAYDNNIEADKMNASISYLTDSKSSEADRLKSTKSVIGTSSIKIQSSIQDSSYVLSEKGRGYYEQSLPFVVGATESTIYLYNSSRGVLQNFSQLGGLSIDSLLSNSNDLVAAVSIIPEIPQFSRDLIKTVKLVLSGAKEKKIRNEGTYSKALDQLNLSEFDNEIQDKKKSKVEELKVEEPSVVKKKEEPKVEETKVVKKKEEPKVEETKVVKKKEEPKVEETKVVKKKEETKLATKKEEKVPAGKKRIYKYICDPAKSEYYWGRTKNSMKLSRVEDSPNGKLLAEDDDDEFESFESLWGVTEIDFDKGYTYDSGSYKYDVNGDGKINTIPYAERSKIKSIDKSRGIYISESEYSFENDPDFAEIVMEVKYTESSLEYLLETEEWGEQHGTGVNPKYWEKSIIQCIRTEYYIDKNAGDNFIKTYAKQKPIAEKSKKDFFEEDIQNEYQAQTNSIFEEVNQQVLNEIVIAEEQYKGVSKNINKNKSLQDESQKFINEVSKEQLKEYKATSMITYFFFESQANYLASLELLYRAYDKNIEADKMKAQISYLKDSKSSENKRLKTTTQIINQASEVLIKDINNKDIKLSEESKVFYQKSLPFAFKATDYGYKVFVVSSAVGKNISNSSDKVGSILVNFKEVIGFATIVPRIPSYVKTVGSTAKLIFSGAKTKKIKDKENLSAALDELDLST